MNISIIGAGGWGTALALQTSKAHKTTLWAFFEEEARQIRETRENADYLKGVKISDSVDITSDVEKAAKGEIIIFVVPSKFYRNVVKLFSPHINNTQHIVSATKGFEYPNITRMSQILTEELKEYKDIIAISGPSHAEEVARNVPTAIVSSSDNIAAAQFIQESLSTDTFRLYRNDDIIGTEVGGAIKNVIAIAAGALRGLGFGDNTMAALITRGLAEIKRAGIKMGAKEESFAGLAGMGDLIVTCMSRHSRNGWVGEQLAKGLKIDDILASTKMVPEGVETVKSAVKIEEMTGAEMPISKTVNNLLFGNISPVDSIKSLMTRPLKNEYI